MAAPLKQAQSRHVSHRAACLLSDIQLQADTGPLRFFLLCVGETNHSWQETHWSRPTAPCELHQERSRPLSEQRHTRKGFACAFQCKSHTLCKRGCLLVQAPKIASVALCTRQDTSLCFFANSISDVLLEMLQSAFLPVAHYLVSF